MMVTSLQHQGREVSHHQPGVEGEGGVGEVYSQPGGSILQTNQPSLHKIAKGPEVKSIMVHIIAHTTRNQGSVICVAT